MKKFALLIDGGYLRALCREAGRKYDPPYIEKVAHACLGADEEFLRVLYYDCAPFSGTAKLPVSKQAFQFSGTDDWLRELGQRELFAVRKGVLKFRGWIPRALPAGQAPLADADFGPSFQQKGVDMRIGLDIAVLSSNRAVDRIGLLTGDTDLIPVMKHARRSGLQVVSMIFPGKSPSRELLEHADLRRSVAWPAA